MNILVLLFFVFLAYGESGAAYFKTEVLPGEVLSGIAKCNRVPEKELENANPRLVGRIIKPGEAIRIPFNPALTSAIQEKEAEIKKTADGAINAEKVGFDKKFNKLAEENGRILFLLYLFVGATLLFGGADVCRFFRAIWNWKGGNRWELPGEGFWFRFKSRFRAR